MSKTSNEQLYDALVRHQTYLLRYSSYLRNRIIEMLNEDERAIASTIRERLFALKGFYTAKELREFKKLLGELAAIRDPTWAKVQEFLDNELTTLAQSEPGQYTNILDLVLPVIVGFVLPRNSQMVTIVREQPVEGRTLAQWVQSLRNDDLRRMNVALRTGIVNGETPAATARRVVGSADQQGRNGTNETTRNQVQSLSRTLTVAVANSARAITTKLNEQVLRLEQFCAVLDARTTPTCWGFDGQIFGVGKGPHPPLHYGCRSIRIAVLASALLQKFPLKPYVEKQFVEQFARNTGLGKITSRKKLPQGSRRIYDAWARKKLLELVGDRGPRVPYETWLKKQSVTYQNDTLGPTRAKLFRQGGLSLQKFVNRDGDALTLAQLAERHAAAFRAAGLNPEDFKM